jgi:hypothetical protein
MAAAHDMAASTPGRGALASFCATWEGLGVNKRTWPIHELPACQLAIAAVRTAENNAIPKRRPISPALNNYSFIS